jgi:hypothetical protein
MPTTTNGSHTAAAIAAATALVDATPAAAAAFALGFVAGRGCSDAEATVATLAPISPSSATDEFISEEGVVDAAWLSSVLEQGVVSARVRDQQKMGGMSGDIKYIDVSLASGKSLAMVLKTGAPSPTRVTMGLAREAFFYNEFAAELGEAGVPAAYYAHGDMATGDTVLLLQCFEGAVPSGTFFGSSYSLSTCNLQQGCSRVFQSTFLEVRVCLLACFDVCAGRLGTRSSPTSQEK